MAILLISRGTMSGVTPLTDSLAADLGYRNVSRENLVARVNEHGEIANRIVASISRATRAYEQFSQLRRPYLILMRLALLEYLVQDNLIYHGYSGHLLVPAFPHVLRVRINAPMRMRVRTTVEQTGCTEQDAKERLLAEDEERGKWARFMYGRDIRNAGLYDLVINLHRVSVSTASRVLACTARDVSQLVDDATRKEVQAMLLSTRVEAELVTDLRTRELEIAARVESGAVKLVGPYLEDEQRSAVLEVTARAAPATSISYETGCAPVFGVDLDAS